MDTATKIGLDAAKAASKRVLQKIAEATGDLIGNKIADKITSLGKCKNKQKKMKLMKLMTQDCLIPSKNGKPKNYKLIRHYI